MLTKTESSVAGATSFLQGLRSPGQTCREPEIFDSDSTPASAKYTPTPLRRTFKFWTPTPA